MPAICWALCCFFINLDHHEFEGPLSHFVNEETKVENGEKTCTRFPARKKAQLGDSLVGDTQTCVVLQGER